MLEENLEVDPEMIRYAGELMRVAQVFLDAARAASDTLLDSQVNGRKDRLLLDPTKIYDMGDRRLTAADLLETLSTAATVDAYSITHNPGNPEIPDAPPMHSMVKVARKGAFRT